MSNAPKRILVIDDDPDIQAVLEVVLHDLGGYVVTMCQSGSEALRVAPDFAPDLILLDMMMPEVDGVMTLQCLRALPELADIPVVFLTARITDPAALLQLPGVVGVIAKPFHHRGLIDQLDRLLVRHDGVIQQHIQPAHLQGLRNEYLVSARRRYDIMRALWEQPTASGLEQLHRHAHQLAGTGAALGFATIGEIASALEAVLAAGTLTPAQATHVSELMIQLGEAIHLSDTTPALWPDRSADR
jgi:CheY-like chemotaxis protein